VFLFKKAVIAVFLVGIFSSVCPGQVLSVPELSLSSSQSADGTVTVSWQSSGEKSVILQQGTGQVFKTIYQGDDSAYVATGLPNGTYYYRIRLSDSTSMEWSESVSLVVEHHSLTKAFGFFALGAVVFIGTLILIITGVRRESATA